MIAALKRGEPFGAELAAVCTALFPPRSMPCLLVRRYARLFGDSNGGDLPHIKGTLGGSFAGTSFGFDYSVGERSVAARGVSICRL